MKYKNLILTSLATMFLASCGAKVDTSSSSQVSELPSSSPIVSSESSFSSVESFSSSSSSFSSFVVDEETVVETKEWDEAIVAMLRYSVGDVAELIPSYKATNYYASIGIEFSEDGLSEIVFTDIKCYPVSGTVIESYKRKLSANGFYHSYSSPYSYCKASATDDLIVQYEVVETDDYEYLSIMAYRVQFREASWPTEFVEALLGNDLPNYGAESYECYFDPYTMTGSVYCDNVNEFADADYGTILLQNGFKTSQSTSASTDYVSQDGFITVTLFMSYDEFDDFALGIKFTNAWPYIDLVSLLGQDWVKYDGGQFSYTYVGSGADQKLTLYYDYVEETDYVSLCSLYEENGCVLTTNYDPARGSYESDTLGTIYYSYYDFTNEYGLFAFDVMYCASMGTIAVAIY